MGFSQPMPTGDLPKTTGNRPPLSTEMDSDNWEFLSSTLMLPGEPQRLDSPIEIALFRCLHYLRQGLPEPMQVDIQGQVQLGQYRVDLLLSSKAGERLVAVECDGHDFHERTKEQAARDKRRDREIMLSHGLPVMRFTGSEIYAAPFLCAADAIAYALSRVSRA